MDHLDQAWNLYHKRHDHVAVLSEHDHNSLINSITRMVKTCLIQQGGEASFKNPVFIKVIRDSVTSGRFNGVLTASAFKTLENYLILLLSQPWKREFWCFKLYGGFFSTRVKAHMEHPEMILALVGYIHEIPSCGDIKSNCLILEKPPESRLLLEVAFDCLVASVESSYIGEYYDKMKCVGLKLQDAMNVLLSGTQKEPIAGSSAFSTVVSQPGTGGSNLNELAGVKVGLITHQTLISSGSAVLMPSSVRNPLSVVGRDGITDVMGHTQNFILPSYADGSSESHPSNWKSETMSRNSGISDAIISRPPSIPYSATPSKLGSSAYTPSSGYGSSGYGTSGYGTSAPSGYGTSASSGYGTSASSGYNSAPHSSAAPYGNAPIGRIGELATNGHANQRHFRPLPPVPQMNHFPYIDEDHVENTTPFPEATHDEHVMESLRSVQKMDVRTGHKSSSSSSVMVDKKFVVPALVTGIPYDDWTWFRGQEMANLSQLNPVAKTYGTNAFADVTTPVYQHNTIERARSFPLQPATAVTSLLNQQQAGGLSEKQSKRHILPLDNHLDKAIPGEYVPSNMVLRTNYLQSAPLESASQFHGRDALDGHVGSHRINDPSADIPLKKSVLSAAAAAHNLCYLPSTGIQYQKPTAPVTWLTSQPPFTDRLSDVKSSGTSSVLLSRHAYATSPMNDLDRVNAGKAFKVPLDGLDSSSAVIMREKSHAETSPRVSSLNNIGDRTSFESRGPNIGDRTPFESRGPNIGDRTSFESRGPLQQGSYKTEQDLTWKCRVCTMDNSSSVMICTACARSRDGPDIQFPTAGESKRVCPACTLENAPGRNRCEMCDTDLPPDVHTYV